METLPNKKRACVLIVDHDLEYGIKLADWLAAHAYQAVLVRSLETAIDECRELRPQAVFIGLSFSEPVATLSLGDYSARSRPLRLMCRSLRWGPKPTETRRTSRTAASFVISIFPSNRSSSRTSVDCCGRN